MLIPWPLLWRYNDPENDFTAVCPSDLSWANVWIAQTSQSAVEQFAKLEDAFWDWAWKVALPFRIWQPVHFIQRLRVLAQWARYLRYAGPLFRLALKLQDQFWVFTKTWRQNCNVQLHRAQRMAHRSILWADVKRIESLTKMQTAFASLPSQIFAKGGHVANHGGSGGGGGGGIGAIIAAKKLEGQQLRHRLQWLKMKLLRSSTRNLASSEIYDRVVDLAQEVTTQVKSAFWNSHLISPQTRFSVGWRIVVTCTLLSEVYRLYWSWELTGTFDMRYTDMTSRLLGLCQSKSRPFRRWIGKVLKLPYNHPWLDTCRQSSPSSQFALSMARMSEIGIDLVGFLDIFVWFYTGELDDEGLVVPKPFFSRCILPGTLIQVLDHPTVPEALPRLIGEAWRIAGDVGYGRVIRWGLALWPAIELFVVSPVYGYLFKPMDKQEYMTYSESLGMMRSFSLTSASALHWPSKDSYPSMVMPSPQSVRSIRSIPDRGDVLGNSMRSLADGDMDGYGLFY